MGAQKEIQEVKNAYKAYEEIEKIKPFSINDLKRIHGIMTLPDKPNSKNQRYIKI